MLRIMEYTQSIRIKKVLIDCVLSFIGFAAPTIGLTFIIQPFMAKSMLANDYGFFLTVISVIRSVSYTHLDVYKRQLLYYLQDSQSYYPSFYAAFNE